MTVLHDSVGSMLAAMRDGGIEVDDPGLISADGEWKRLRGAGHKRGTKNIAVRLHGDHGYAKDHSSGIEVSWSAKSGQRISPSSLIAAKAAAAQRMADDALNHDRVARDAARIWEEAQAAPADHPYLTSKCIQPGPARLAQDGRLMLRIQNVEGETRNLQRIDAEGTKRPLYQGEKVGNFIVVAGELPQDAESNDLVIICEGFATGMSIVDMYPSTTVLAALDCGNLPAVARAVRQKYPAAMICLAADDDHHRADNPGMTKAREAAAAVDGFVIRPAWPGGKAIAGQTDFNDLAAMARARGLAEVPVDDWIAIDGENDDATVEDQDHPADDFLREASELDFWDAADAAWPAPNYVLGALQAGDVGLLSGADGVGKGWVALAAGLSVALGRSVCRSERTARGIFELPANAAPGKVLYFAVEDRVADHGRRMAAIARQLRIEGIKSRCGEQFKIVALKGKRLPLMQRGDDGIARPTAEGMRWARAIEGYKLVIIDPLRAFHDLTENDGQHMDAFIRWLVSVAMTNGQVILVVHHASQTAILDRREDHHSGRGATDFPAGCRAVWTLRAASPTEVEEAERRDWKVLVNGKASHDREAGATFLRRGADGVLYADAAPLPLPPSSPRKAADNSNRRNRSVL